MFAQEHNTIYNEWLKEPYLALLAIKDEKELHTLISKLENSKIKFSAFREPDINNQITSICIEPSDKTRRLTSSLPKMLKELYDNRIDKNNYVKEYVL